MILATALLLLLVPQEEKEAREHIHLTAGRHFGRYDVKQRLEAVDEMVALWKSLPAGDLRDRALLKIVRTIESSTEIFLLDPAQAELIPPDRFHLRAYDIARRRLKAIVASAAAFPSRTAEAKDKIAEQINGLFEAAQKAIVAKSDDPATQRVIREELEHMKSGTYLKVLDEPFSGYLKPLAADVLVVVREKILRAVASMPRLVLEEGERGPRLPGAFRTAQLAMYDIGRSYDPARFATYDDEKTLLDEVRAWRSEEIRKSSPRKESEK